VRFLKPALVVLACVVLLAIAIHDVDPARVISIIASADRRLLAGAVLLDGGIFLIKSLKWRYIFVPIRRLPVVTFFGAIAVGALASNVLPFRLDELVRTYYFGQKGGVRKATVLGTIVVERLIDATTLLAAMVVLFFAFGARDWVLRGGGTVLAALAVVAAMVAGLVTLRHRIVHLAERRVPGRYREVRSRLVSIYGALTLGLAAFPRAYRIAVVFAFAVAEWLVALLQVRLVLSAFGQQVPMVGLLLVVTAGYLSFAMPSIPGALGVFEVLVKTSLAAGFSINADAALSCALTLHGLLVVPISLLGAAFLLREGWSLGRLRQLGAGPAVAGAAKGADDSS
jgi:uncharacterized protein (TIRG00374 family)